MVKKTKKDIDDLKDQVKTEDGHAQEGEPPQGMKADVGIAQDDQALALEEKTRECAENYDKYVRAVAELDNYKKRAAKEKAEAIKYGNETLIRDMLPLVDSMARALKHAETSCDFDSFKKGLAMLQEQLICSLNKHGVEAIDCVKKPFDPNYHEALMQVASSDHEHNHVVDELEKGYLLNGRLLRPSKVSVCKRTDDGGQC